LLRLHSLVERVKKHLQFRVESSYERINLGLVGVSFGKLLLGSLDLKTLGLDIDIHIVVDIDVDDP
jgi:hypothetical protein